MNHGQTNSARWILLLLSLPLLCSSGAWALFQDPGGQKDPPQLTSPAEAAGTVGINFSYRITVTGTPFIQITVASLPPGLTTFSSSDGATSITGTPTQAGTYSVIVTATNPYGTDQQTVTVRIASDGGGTVPGEDPPTGGNPGGGNPGGSNPGGNNPPGGNDPGGTVPGGGGPSGNPDPNAPTNPDRDADGDHFPDDLETALGSNPNDATSTPFGILVSGEPSLLDVQKFRLRLIYSKSGFDRFVVRLAVPVPDGFQVENEALVFYCAGVVLQGNLDRKGVSRKGTPRNEMIKMKLKKRKKVVMAQNARVLAWSKRGTFSDRFVDDGMTGDADLKKASRSLLMLVIFNGTLYRAVVPVKWTVRANKAGKAK